MKLQYMKFVASYILDDNATKAAIDAGYSEHTAYSQGSRLLKNVEIKAAIRREQKKLLTNAVITKEMVIKGLKNIAFADTRKLYKNGSIIRDVTELPKEMALALNGVELEDVFEGEGKERKRIGSKIRYKLPDKNQAFELLGRTVKAFTDKIEITDTTGLAEKVKSARERANASTGKPKQ